MQRQSVWVVLLVLYAGAIFAISSAALPPDNSPRLFPGFDKLVHAIEFGVLFLLAWKATKRRLALSLIIAVSYAATDEIHQAFTSLRDASLLDFVADSIGIALACVALTIRRRVVLPGGKADRILDPTSTKPGD